MKRKINTKLIFVSILAATSFYACKKDMSTVTPNTVVPHYGFNSDNGVPGSYLPIYQTNFVANTIGYNTLLLDPLLTNPWGIAAAPNGPVWIGDNGSHFSTVYNRKNGVVANAPVAILGALPKLVGSPTGVVFNPNPTDFGGYSFIFASEDGTISAWKAGVTTTVVINNSASHAVYKGLAIATGDYVQRGTQAVPLHELF